MDLIVRNYYITTNRQRKKTEIHWTCPKKQQYTAEEDCTSGQNEYTREMWQTISLVHKYAEEDFLLESASDCTEKSRQRTLEKGCKINVCGS